MQLCPLWKEASASSPIPSYREIHGDIFTSNAEAIVNTVNCVGAMGKGIALEFKKRYPDLYATYREACARKEIQPGHVWIYQAKVQIIFNAAVKNDWRDASRIEWVESCLHELIEHCRTMKVKSLALPWMGAMNGWIPIEQIQASTRRILSGISDFDISVYAIRNIEGASASSIIKKLNDPEYNRRFIQAAKELKAAMSPQAPAPYNFEWEAHMDTLMAPPEQPQTPTREEHPGRLIEVYDYVPSGDKIKKRVVGHAELVPMERQEFPSKTTFPQEFPTPVVCREFCDTHSNCHLRQNGFGDLCKQHDRLGKLVHPVDLKWSAWHEFRTRLPKTEMVHSSRTHGDVPEIALAHWGSPDAPMDDNGANGNGEYESPAQQAREFGDRDAVGFVPAFIFGPGKHEWRTIVKEDRAGAPYLKFVKYPSIRPIACKIELRNGYVVPVGKFGSMVKITTRADKKRMRAYSAIKKELTPYVGVERAGKMAGREVAAMATC